MCTRMASETNPYWVECARAVFEEFGYDPTTEQCNIAGEIIQNSHENFGLSQGYDSIGNPALEVAKRDFEARILDTNKRQQVIEHDIQELRDIIKYWKHRYYDAIEGNNN